MHLFWKHLGISLLWLLLSEILCLVLAVSVAILRASVLTNAAGLICGMTAHILLIGSCAAKIAQADAAAYQKSGIRTASIKPLLISVLLTVPSYLTYLILLVNADSVLWLNLFPLLNAPFIQIYRVLINGTEPFSAIAQTRRMLMLLPPLLTGISFFAGYYFRYLPQTAKADAIRSRK